MRSPDTLSRAKAAFAPLLATELRQVVTGRALWTMLLILCPLTGYGFAQAVSLYAEASSAARDAPALASGLSPLDGILVPTFGGLYLTVTLLFPFVAIRTLGREKETGALRLLVQLPYSTGALIISKMTAIFAAWLIAVCVPLSAVLLWTYLGGHIHTPELANLLLGQSLFGVLVGAIALWAAAVSESSATAAIVALAFTIGSWVLDFAVAGQPDLLDRFSRLSLTQTLKTFEQGLLSLGLVLGIACAACGFAALAGVWLHPGRSLKRKLALTIVGAVAIAAALAASSQIRSTSDLTEDRRNSFSAADERLLAELTEPLHITVHLAPEDPRYVDFRRNVLSKLDRVVRQLVVRLDTTGRTVLGSASAESYGEIEYEYGGRSDRSRSTSPREILPLIYALADKAVPTANAGQDYPGYPLTADAAPALAWFLGFLPLLVVLAWLWTRMAPRVPNAFKHEMR